MGETTELFIPGPIPSKNSIPEWYKKFPMFVRDEQENGMHPVLEAKIPNTTLKACVPFLDALTMGYMVVLACDIEFRKLKNNDVTIRWLAPYVHLVEGHNIDQTFAYPINNNEIPQASKWLFDWKIETPKGYSTVYTHPLNRHDLPFRTFSGVVDTDVFPDAVHFPFQVLPFEGERIIIPAGTPLCQLFPTKRESWNSQKEDFSQYRKPKASFEVLKYMVRSYKRQFWHKKTYN